MIVYVNENGEIHDVGTTQDESLIEVEILDDEENPFTGWSDAKICCYKIHVTDGHVDMMTPYVDSRLIDFIDKYGTMTEDNKIATEENSDAIIEVSQDADERITELEDALIEIANALAK